MKKTAALLLAACLLAVLPLRAQSTAGKDDKPVKFKDFTVTEAPGQVKKLSDYAGKGKYLLVDFWASWCGPCRRAVPVIKDLYKQYRGDKFEVLSVAVSDCPSNARTCCPLYLTLAIFSWTKGTAMPTAVPRAAPVSTSDRKWLPLAILRKPVVAASV